MIVAEGVETQAEADAVRTLGVDLAQGYLFAQGYGITYCFWPERQAATGGPGDGVSS